MEPKQRQDNSELLVDLYKTLFRFWISRGISQDKAEDLAQEGVLRALQNLAKYQGKANATLKTFLTVVGKNGGIDYLRKEAKQERIGQRVSEIVESHLKKNGL